MNAARNPKTIARASTADTPNRRCRRIAIVSAIGNGSARSQKVGTAYSP
jgi:hypothetical protein